MPPKRTASLSLARPEKKPKVAGKPRPEPFIKVCLKANSKKDDNIALSMTGSPSDIDTLLDGIMHDFPDDPQDKTTVHVEDSPSPPPASASEPTAAAAGPKESAIATPPPAQPSSASQPATTAAAAGEDGDAEKQPATTAAAAGHDGHSPGDNPMQMAEDELEKLSASVAPTPQVETPEEAAMRRASEQGFPAHGALGLRFNRSATGGQHPEFRSMKLTNQQKSEFRKKWAENQYKDMLAGKEK